MTGNSLPGRPGTILVDPGRKISVVLSVFEYEQLLEHLSGLAAAANRHGEETVDHAALIRRLQAGGLL